MQGIRLRLGVIYPYLHAVPLEIELCYQPVSRHTFYPDGVHLGIWSHECYVCRPFPDSLLVHNHLFGRLLPEYVQFMLGFSCETAERVFHVVFHKLRNAVSDYSDRAHQRVQESHFLRLRLIFVVIVLVNYCVEPVKRVLDVPQAEKTPVVSAHSRIRPFQEDG